MKGRNENKEKEYLSHTMAPPFNFKCFFGWASPKDIWIPIIKIDIQMNKKVTKDFSIPRNDILNAILRQAQNDKICC